MFLKDLKHIYYTDSEWLGRLSEFYQQELYASENTEALEYCRKRQLLDPAVAPFGIGYAPSAEKQLELFRSWRVPSEVLQRNGIATYDTNYCKFENRIMCPYYDLRGRVIGFTGRIYNDPSDSLRRKYLHSPGSAIFQKSLYLYGLRHAYDAIAENGYAVIVEGPIDAISLHRVGLRHTIACSGTAFTELHLGILLAITDTLLFWFDNDEAGNRAYEKASELCTASGMLYSRIEETTVKDPDDAACMMSTEALHYLLTEAYVQRQ